MIKISTALIPLLIMLGTVSCTRNNAQRDFEEDAYMTPSGFTETNSQAEIISLDEDDWRTSPLFQGLINVVPAIPNPVATNQSVQIDLELTGVNSVNGLEVLTRYPDNSFGTLYQNFETLNPGITTFFINPLELGLDGSPEAARRLKRIFLFNGNGQMISYGDIMVE